MNHEWWSCDGNGGSGSEPKRTQGSPVTMATRRGVLLSMGSALMMWAGRRSALAKVAVDQNRRGRHVMVVIFLRGGADGLNVVVPHAEDAYYRARPTLAIARPNDSRSTAKARSVDLDGFFGLHPAMAPLHPLYANGQMAIVHACGSQDQTRSHFEAMSTVERGAERDHEGQASGWLARYMMSAAGDDSPIRAVAFADTVPDSLRGASNAIAVQSLDDFSLTGGPSFEGDLKRIYGGRDAVAHAGQQTLEVLKTLRSLDVKSYRPSGGATYPKSDLGEGLRQVACLVRGDLGLEIACLDKGGWDTHVAQGADTGWQASLITDLSTSLAAFSQDMGPEMNRVTVLVMSEFGRRVAENAGLGTDHGRGGPLFVLGGNVKGGHVKGTWPGLEPHQLDEVGDLRVTTDYRSALAETLNKHLGCSKIDAIFPSLPTQSLGLFPS